MLRVMGSRQSLGVFRDDVIFLGVIHGRNLQTVSRCSPTDKGTAQFMHSSILAITIPSPQGIPLGNIWGKVGPSDLGAGNFLSVLVPGSQWDKSKYLLPQRLMGQHIGVHKSESNLNEWRDRNNLSKLKSVFESKCNQ